MAKLILWLIMPLYMWGVTITEDTTLSGDVVYNEDVIVDGAILNLNNYSMTVDGNLTIQGYNGRLQMTKLNDKLIVSGDLTFAGASTYQDLTNGVIELTGNFYQKGTRTKIGYHSTRDSTYDGTKYQSNNAFSFYPTDKHKVILNGTSKQIIDFEAPNNSRFNHLEIQNSSNDGVIFEQLNVVGEWKRNGNQVKITDIRNLTLTEDYTIPNDVDVISGILNLNGYTLTVNGNLIIQGYNGRLQMTKLNDKLIVSGDLTFAGASTYQDLTNGVIELTGNFYQKGTRTKIGYHSTRDSTYDGTRYQSSNAYSFYPTDKHKVILNGAGQQIIDFEAPDSSQFANLEISNSSAVIDVSTGKKLKVIGDLYLDESLYNSTYKDSDLITYGRYRDIHKTYMTIYRGLNLIALPIKTTITESQIYTIFSDQNISHVLKYDSDSQQWQGFGNSEVARKKIADNGVAQLNSIRAGEGFFVKAESEVELKFPRGEEYGIESININRLSSGWHLLGTNRLIELDKLLKDNRNIKLLWRYSQNKWSFLSNDNEIQDEYRRREIPQSEDTNATNSGFWIYIE